MTGAVVGRTEVLIHQARERDQAIDAAVRRLQVQALSQGTSGILVTRHAPGRFTVELSSDVPYGYTYEKP